MKKKVIISAAMALAMTVLAATPANAASTSMSVGGCTIGCASNLNSSSGTGLTTNGNSSITCKVDCTLVAKKGSAYTYPTKSASATASVTAKVTIPTGYSAILFSTHHTAVYGGKSYTRDTSVSS